MTLRRYIAYRFMMVVPVFLGVTLIAFLISYSTSFPAAPYINEYMTPAQIQQVIKEHGFDQPAIVRYLYFMRDLVHGDLGFSQSVGLTVVDAIRMFFPATIELAVTALLISVVAGIPLGARAALSRGKRYDHMSSIGSLMGTSLPPFILAFLLQYIFFYEFRILNLPFLPSTGRTTLSVPFVTGFTLIDSLIAGNPAAALDWLRHIILPSTTLAFITLAPVTRIVRASLLEVLGKEYIVAARAKGISEKLVLYRHAMRNALLPVITSLGYLFGTLLGGAIITETVFAWPGVGRWVTFAITSGDVAAVTGFTLVMGIAYVLINAFVDIMYAFFDPRVKLG
jgi:peptide/nickel transport system permease protein